jgi:hypothetical protein
MGREPNVSDEVCRAISARVTQGSDRRKRAVCSCMTLLSAYTYGIEAKRQRSAAYKNVHDTLYASANLENLLLTSIVQCNILQPKQSGYTIVDNSYGLERCVMYADDRPIVNRQSDTEGPSRH